VDSIFVSINVRAQPNVESKPDQDQRPARAESEPTRLRVT
jgi:hypothetical protein